MGNRDIDEMKVDETDAYRKNMGKWSQRSFKNISDPLFWVMLRISYTFSSVLDVMLWTVQKYSSPSPKNDPLAGTDDAELGNLARLVFWQSQVIYESLLKMLDLPFWSDVLTWCDETLASHPLRIDVMSKLPGAIVKAALRLCSDYKRRVMDVLAQPPYCLLLIAMSQPAVKCERRLKVVKDMLDTPVLQLHLGGRH